MVVPEKPMSVAGQRALQDMVELQMYLVAQSQRTLWSLLPRRSKRLDETRKPHSNPVESSTVKELMDRGFIEGTSSRTWVVSRSGYQFYHREMKKNFQLDPSRMEKDE